MQSDEWVKRKNEQKGKYRAQEEEEKRKRELEREVYLNDLAAQRKLFEREEEQRQAASEQERELANEARYKQQIEFDRRAAEAQAKNREQVDQYSRTRGCITCLGTIMQVAVEKNERTEEDRERIMSRYPALWTDVVMNEPDDSRQFGDWREKELCKWHGLPIFQYSID